MILFSIEIHGDIFPTLFNIDSYDRQVCCVIYQYRDKMNFNNHRNLKKGKKTERNLLAVYSSENLIRKTCFIIYDFSRLNSNQKGIKEICMWPKCNQNLPIISYLVALQCSIVDTVLTPMRMINLPIHWSLCGR